MDNDIRQLLEATKDDLLDLKERFHPSTVQAKRITKRVKQIQKALDAPQDWFVITRLHRDDFEAVGYDGSGVDEYDMQRLADRIGSNLTEFGDYWEALKVFAEDAGLPTFQGETA